MRHFLLYVVMVTLAAEDLPSYRGADGSGRQLPWSGSLLTDIKQARVLWTGEEQNFGVGWGYGTGPANKNRDVVQGCGFSGPIAVGDSVYFSWFVPSGDVVDEVIRKKGKDQRAASWTVDADDVLVCLDAETGKTRWKAVVKGKGLNWGYHRKCPWTHVAVVGGKVFWLGSAGRVYCHNAADGSLIWDSHTGEGFKELEKMRAKMHQAKSVETWQKGLRIKDGDSSSPINTSPCVADGVVVVNDSLCDSGYRNINTDGVGLVGLDAKTGRLLWRKSKLCGVYVSPLVSTIAGKKQVIVSGPRGLVGLEPSSGSTLWEVKGPMGAGVTPAVGDGYVLVQRHRVRGRIKDMPEGAKGLSCWKFVSGKPELQWEKEPGPWSGGFAAPLIIDGHGWALTRQGLIGVKLDSGQQVGEPVKAGDAHCPLTASGNMILAGSHLVAASQEGPRLLGTVPGGREMYTTAFITAGRVYVRGRLPGYENKNRAGKQPPEPGCIKCIDLRQ